MRKIQFGMPTLMAAIFIAILFGFFVGRTMKPESTDQNVRVVKTYFVALPDVGGVGEYITTDHEVDWLHQADTAFMKKVGEPDTTYKVQNAPVSMMRARTTYRIASAAPASW